MSGSSKKIVDGSDQELVQSTVKSLYACLVRAQIKKSSQVEIKFSDLSRRVEPACSSYVALPIEMLEVMFKKIYNNGQKRK